MANGDGSDGSSDYARKLGYASSAVLHDYEEKRTVSNIITVNSLPLPYKIDRPMRSRLS